MADAETPKIDATTRAELKEAREAEVDHPHLRHEGVDVDVDIAARRPAVDPHPGRQIDGEEIVCLKTEVAKKRKGCALGIAKCRAEPRVDAHPHARLRARLERIRARSVRGHKEERGKKKRERQGSAKG